MSDALPPPEPRFDYTVQGILIGLFFAAGAAFTSGAAALIFPALGALIGYTVDQHPTD